jgi:hypothetical protein
MNRRESPMVSQLETSVEKLAQVANTRDMGVGHVHDMQFPWKRGSWPYPRICHMCTESARKL